MQRLSSAIPKRTDDPIILISDLYLVFVHTAIVECKLNMHDTGQGIKLDPIFLL